ncbi:putative glycosyltransferase EpsF [Deinococcus aerolatus]|uniref:Glycosyltransferase EpsF n=1 Tax=Deinococcus aerolatus TaxID=522487 RepID=A0ABQ2G554_9DEIO|nr:glycosyltransferase family 1 protein [Deinococcus aerolatus]GGL75099.1 putative glycosyltransferase EpsF [Deinococcus aerolatus]
MTTITSDQNRRPIRVLHVVGSMNRGGVETWLMNVLRNVDRNELAFDFMIHKPEAAAYDDEMQALGAGRYVCKWPTNPLSYVINFFKIIKDHGPYDAVHSHVHHFSGFVLLLAKFAGIKIRVSHSHNDSSEELVLSRGLRLIYLKTFTQLIKLTSTSGLAASEKAAAALFGEDWKTDGRWKVSFCGIDLKPFRRPVSRSTVRDSLGVKDGSIVFGHVGRFEDQKNHEFLIDIFSKIKQKMPTAMLLLVGDGELRQKIVSKVIHLNLSESVIFAGLRDDIPTLMTGAMDAFVFPSKFEGLGLAIVEAQAAGLDTFISDNMPHEVNISDNTFLIPLTHRADDWADYIINNLGYRESTANSKIAMFDIKNSIASLTKLYNHTLEKPL